jgi:4-amino-4-deoxy-L-arabinose transferase-like glycosyltransferase
MMSLDAAQEPAKPDWGASLARAAWWVLVALYLIGVFVFSIIQPLGRCPDEPAHVQYARFIAENHRLPLWSPQPGGGEGGYEAQHPPLYYTVMAVVWAAGAPLEERWRWHLMRWAMALLVGLPLFATVRRLALDVFSPSRFAPLVVAATVMLMPLTLLYMCHTNPDGMAMLWGTCALWLAIRAARKPDDLRLAAWLGLVCGLGALTKLSAAPTLLVGLAALTWGQPQERRAAALRPLAVCVGVFALTCGWWYVRCRLLYGTAFTHTPGQYGSGLENALVGGFGFFAKLTWRETYLSTWAQRGWFPTGAWTGVLYGVIVAMTALTAGGLIWARLRNSGPAALRWPLNLAGLQTALIFAGQQWAFWTVDVEFNAGGRYMLVALAAIALLWVSVLSRFRPGSRKLLGGVWLASLLAMNITSAWNIWAVLNPRYAPAWQIFHFPG